MGIVLVFLGLMGTCQDRPPAARAIEWRDIGPDSGVAFRFDHGSRGKHDLPEIMGGGAALIDGQCLEKYGQTNESYAQPIAPALQSTKSRLILAN